MDKKRDQRDMQGWIMCNFVNLGKELGFNHKCAKKSLKILKQINVPD